MSGVSAAASLDAASIVAKNRPEACTNLKPAVGFFEFNWSSLSKPKLALIFSNALICNRD